MSGLVNVRHVALDVAALGSARARERAVSLGLRICVAVVDPAGGLISFDRMDGAPLLTVRLAQDKAHTVAAFGLATHEWWPQIKDDPTLVHGLAKTERFIVIAGGVPITQQGDLIGAIGVSGGTPHQDREIAELAALACQEHVAE